MNLNDAMRHVAMRHYWIEDDGAGGILRLSDAHPYMLLRRPEISFSAGRWQVRPAREYDSQKNYTEYFDTEAEAQAGYQAARCAQRTFHLSNLGGRSLEEIEREWAHELIEWVAVHSRDQRMSLVGSLPVGIRSMVDG